MRSATSMLLLRRYETSISPLGWLHKCISQRNHSYPFHSSLCILNFKHHCISRAFFYTFTTSDRARARCKCLFALKEYKTWSWEWLFKDNFLCTSLAVTPGTYLVLHYFAQHPGGFSVHGNKIKYHLSSDTLQSFKTVIFQT